MIYCSLNIRHLPVNKPEIGKRKMEKGDRNKEMVSLIPYSVFRFPVSLLHFSTFVLIAFFYILIT